MSVDYNIGSKEVYWTANTTGAQETSLGYTSGGITLSVAKETKEVEADQLSAPIDEYITKGTITVSCPFIGITIDKLQSIFPGSTIVTDATTATKKKLLIGNMAGEALSDYAGMLRLHTVGADANDKSKDWLFPLAAPTGDSIELSFAKDDLTTLTITYKALAPTTGTYAGKTCVYGDPTATA